MSYTYVDLDLLRRTIGEEKYRELVNIVRNAVRKICERYVPVVNEENIGEVLRDIARAYTNLGLLQMVLQEVDYGKVAKLFNIDKPQLVLFRTAHLIEHSSVFHEGTGTIVEIGSDEYTKVKLRRGVLEFLYYEGHEHATPYCGGYVMTFNVDSRTLDLEPSSTVLAAAAVLGVALSELEKHGISLTEEDVEDLHHEYTEYVWDTTHDKYVTTIYMLPPDKAIMAVIAQAISPEWKANILKRHGAFIGEYKYVVHPFLASTREVDIEVFLRHEGFVGLNAVRAIKALKYCGVADDRDVKLSLCVYHLYDPPWKLVQKLEPARDLLEQIVREHVKSAYETARLDTRVRHVLNLLVPERAKTSRVVSYAHALAY